MGYTRAYAIQNSKLGYARAYAIQNSKQKHNLILGLVTEKKNYW